MDKFTKGAADALQQYDEAGRRTRWPPLKSEPLTNIWAPTLTEQERAEREQQIAAGIIPF
jgi:hypothetical protein